MPPFSFLKMMVQYDAHDEQETLVSWKKHRNLQFYPSIDPKNYNLMLLWTSCLTANELIKYSFSSESRSCVHSDMVFLTWTVHPFVVVGVDTHILLFGAKRVLAAFQCLQLVVGLQVRPAPHPTVNDMWQALPVGHLQPSIQRARDRHTVTGLTWAAESPLQLFHGSLLLFQFLNQRIHGLFCPLLLLVPLLPTQQPFDRGAGEGEEWRNIHCARVALLHSPKKKAWAEVYDRQDSEDEMGEVQNCFVPQCFSDSKDPSSESLDAKEKKVHVSLNHQQNIVSHSQFYWVWILGFCWTAVWTKHQEQWGKWLEFI